MNHRFNSNLPKGVFRVVCTKCGKIFIQDYGDLTTGALAAMKFSEICSDCGGEVVLETNPS